MNSLAKAQPINPQQGKVSTQAHTCLLYTSSAKGGARMEGETAPSVFVAHRLKPTSES